MSLPLPEPDLQGPAVARAAVPAHRPQATSSVMFSPGVAADRNDAGMSAVALVLLEVSPAVRRAVYEYAHSLQRLTQRLRIVVVSDGADLKEVRRYGWMVEHILSRSDLAALEPAADWVEMTTGRLTRLVERLDIAQVLVADDRGISRLDHDRLARAIKTKVSFEAIFSMPVS